MSQPRRGRRTTGAAIAALLVGLAVLAALPLSGSAQPKAAQEAGAVTDLLRAVDDTARRALAPVRETLEEVRRAVTPPAARPTPAAGAGTAAQEAERLRLERKRRATAAQDPATEPPLHGTSPHGQGSVAVLDLAPSNDRPAGADPAGSDTGEEAVVGRAKGEQRPDGTYHGHITIAALFGNEILGVDTGPGETQAGPLDALQTNVLDTLCAGSANNLCLSAVRADSATTADGTTNRFTTLGGTVGGAQGISLGVAESTGNAADDGTCQTTSGTSSVAGLSIAGRAVAGVATSSTQSRACKGQAPEQTSSSRVLELGGAGLPLPAAGCADGTPDTVTGIPALAPIVCNADETNGGQAPVPSGVREALSVFVLATGSSSLLKATTAASESHAQAPPAQCADGVDNDGDGRVDAADPGCHSDGDPGNPDSYVPSDDDETDPAGGGSQGDDDRGPTGGQGESARDPECSDRRDNDGDGRIDAADPGCHTDGNADNPASYDPGDDSEGGDGAGGAQCADGVDNDGDGRIDAADPGCHTDGDASNPASYDPSDDSEGSGSGAVAGRRAQGALPMTGSGVLGLAMTGLVLVAAGLALRRRPGGDPA